MIDLLRWVRYAEVLRITGLVASCFLVIPSANTQSLAADFSRTSIGGTSAKDCIAGEVITHARVLSHLTIIESTGRGAYHQKEEITIEVLDRTAAERFRIWQEHFGEDEKIQDFTASLLAKDSKVIRARAKEFSDHAVQDGMSIARSGQIRVVELPLPAAYPAVYSFSVVKTVRETIGMPSISFYYGPGIEVQAARLEIIDPKRELRTKVVDSENNITVEERAGGVTSFGVSLLPARDQVDADPGVQLGGPSVLLAPKTGRLEGTQGDFQTWEGIGAWTASLLVQRDELPAVAVADIERLVAGVDDIYARIRLVYTYMQARTHYVSIQLGIGGFRPMDPAEVHELGYGDCKALSNYTRLLLRAAGVRSNYCVIGVGEREIIYPQFASVNQANHAMLAVQVPGDTLWLECTSQMVPAGFIGENASGRLALMIDGNSGRLVRVQGRSAQTHARTSRALVRIAPDGSAHFERTSHLVGDQVGGSLSLKLSTGADREALLRRRIGIVAQGLTASVSSAFDPSDGRPIATIQESGQLQNYGRKAGNRLVVPAASLLPQLECPGDLTDRQRPIQLESHEIQRDTIDVLLPEGLMVGSLLPPVVVAGPQGRYQLTMLVIEQGVRVVREIELHRGVYSADSAVAIGAFYDTVNRSDRSVLTLLLRTDPVAGGQP